MKGVEMHHNYIDLIGKNLNSGSLSAILSD